jgi:hypothetical protein
MQKKVFQMPLNKGIPVPSTNDDPKEEMYLKIFPSTQKVTAFCQNVVVSVKCK